MGRGGAWPIMKEVPFLPLPNGDGGVGHHQH
jgi:hypothetical protein